MQLTLNLYYVLNNVHADITERQHLFFYFHNIIHQLHKKTTSDVNITIKNKKMIHIITFDPRTERLFFSENEDQTEKIEKKTEKGLKNGHKTEYWRNYSLVCKHLGRYGIGK